MLKRLFITTAIASASLVGYSQIISDSVELGSGYSNQVFYQLSSGNKATSSNLEWDMQFFSSLFSAAVRVNSGVGVELYQAVTTDTANFATSTIDTSSLTILRDGYATWETSAFTSQQTGHPNYGWGTYQGLGNIFGFKVYVIKLSSGDFKKIWLKSIRTNGSLEFAMADLDGSNLFSKIINRSAYSTKRHFYYDADNDSIYDAEPMRTQWELVFRKYNDLVAPNVYYNVTGALSNDGLAIAQVNNTDVLLAKNNWNNHTYDSAINIIGGDWKNFNMTTFSWEITDSLSYIMKDYNGDVYQLVFTGTSGAGTGKLYFTKELFSTASLEENSPVMNVGVFPNPANSQLNVNFELNESSSPATIMLLDMNGRQVRTIANNFVNTGFNQITTDISDLKNGVYLLQIVSGNKAITKRVVKQ